MIDSTAILAAPVSFGGHPVTDYVPLANILDVRIGAPGIESSTFASGYKAGSNFVRRRHTPRTIEVDVELPLDRDTYPENARIVRAWADSKEPLELLLSAYPGRIIHATCTNLNEISQKEWWLPVTVVFQAWEPYFISAEQKTASIGQAFVVEGDVPPLLSIVHTIKGQRVESPRWTVDGKKYIMLDQSFGDGVITIDFDNQSCMYNGQSVMQALTLTSRFAEIEPGQHTIDGPEGGIVTWYERWL